MKLFFVANRKQKRKKTQKQKKVTTLKIRVDTTLTCSPQLGAKKDAPFRPVTPQPHHSQTQTHQASLLKKVDRLFFAGPIGPPGVP